MSATTLTIIGATIGIVAAVVGAVVGSWSAHRYSHVDLLAEEHRKERREWEREIVVRLGSLETAVAGLTAILSRWPPLWPAKQEHDR